MSYLCKGKASISQVLLLADGNSEITAATANSRDRQLVLVESPSLKYTPFTDSYLGQGHGVGGVQACRVILKTKEHFAAVLAVQGYRESCLDPLSCTIPVPLHRWMKVIQLSTWHIQGCINSSQKLQLGMFWMPQTVLGDISHWHEIRSENCTYITLTHRFRETENLLNT